MPSEEQFFNKLGEIPVLNDGLTTAWNYYARVKDYNTLTKFTMGVAESGVKKAVSISTPVVSHYQSQIDLVNDYACRKLDEIENKYPLIKQPSGEVKDACIEYIQPVVGRVKPVVNYVQDVVSNSKRRVKRVKQCGTDLVIGARDLGVNSMSHAVNATLSTRPGRLVVRSVDSVLIQADGLMEKYIPEETEGDDASDDGNGHDDGGSDNHEEVEEMEEMEPSPERVYVHFKSVSGKLQKRMFQRAMRDFHGAKVHTMDTIGKLHNTVDLIDYAKKNFGAARSKLEDIWNQITDTTDQSGENANNGSVQAGALEERIVALGRTLAHQLRSGITTLEKTANEAGLFVKHPITKSKEYKDFVYQFSSDMMNLSVDKARASLAFIQKKLQTLIDNMESPEWLAVNIEMEDIGLEEADINSDNQPSEEETEDPSPENQVE